MGHEYAQPINNLKLKVPTYLDGSLATNVKYTRPKNELTQLRTNIQDAIAAGFNGWKDLIHNSDFAFLDLSTTSRGSAEALGHNVKYKQTGYNETDLEASWLEKASIVPPGRMDCYV